MTNGKYHIMFTPKCRMKELLRNDVGESLRTLCEGKGKMGYLKGKSSLMIFDRHAYLRYKLGNRYSVALMNICGWKTVRGTLG